MFVGNFYFLEKNVNKGIKIKVFVYNVCKIKVNVIENIFICIYFFVSDLCSEWL